jgi:hypothetical protein
VRKEDILDRQAWEYFGRDRHWTSNPREAIEIIPAPVGEGSIIWNPAIGRWDVHLSKRKSRVQGCGFFRFPTFCTILV